MGGGGARQNERPISRRVQLTLAGKSRAAGEDRAMTGCFKSRNVRGSV